MLILILILFLQCQPIVVNAYETPTYYARILFEQVYLYKSPNLDNSSENIYFEVPKTYFVQLLSENDNFYEAKYQNFIGYVKKDSVQAVAGTPNQPFLNNISFRVYSELSQNIWSQPTTQNNSQTIIKIPNLTKNISYIGKVNGQCLIEGRTNIWFFCKYTNANKDYFGYVYSDFCDEMTNFNDNTEELNYISNPTFEVNTQITNSIPQNNNSVGIIIGIISIPAIIFVFMLMRSGKILNHDKLKRNEVIDYQS